MNCRERILSALNMEEPDRVPCHTILIDGNNCDEILGYPQKTEIEIAEEIRQNNPDGWYKELNGIVESIEVITFSRWVEAAIAIGLDVMQFGMIPFYFVPYEEIEASKPAHINIDKDKFWMKDIFGRVWMNHDNAGNFDPYYMYGTTTIENWEETKEKLLGPLKEKYIKQAKKTYRRVNKKYKDKIFVIGTNNYLGVWDSAWQGMGIEYYAKNLRKNPRFIKDVHETITEFNLALYNAYMDVGCEVFLEDGDLAYKKGPMMSPKQFEEFILPNYKRIVENTHERGCKHVLHSDGNLMRIMDLIVECGFDGFHSMEPTAGMDIAEMKQKYGDKLCLWGNIDVAETLFDGTKEDVFNEVKYCIKNAGQGGGLIISASNMHPGVKVQNLRWMVEATKEFGTYPLNI